jgi:hypothetical protein
MSGFSQEIRFKIGGDSSSIQKTFDSLPAMAERAGRKVDKAMGTFSGARGMREKLEKFRAELEYKQSNTLGKISLVTASLRGAEEARNKFAKGTTQHYQAQLDILKNQAQLKDLNEQHAGETKDAGGGGQKTNWRQVIGAGIGSAVAWALGRAIANQQAGIEFAGAQQQSRQAGIDSLTSRFSAIGGLQGQLHQGQRKEADLEVQKKFAQSRANELSTGLQGAVSMIAPEELTKSKVLVEQLNAEIQKQHDLNALTARDLRRQSNEYNYQKYLLESTIYFQQNHGSALDIAKSKAAGMRDRNTFMAAHPADYTKQETNQARLEFQSAMNDVVLLSKEMQARAKSVKQELTQDASGGRTFRNGAPRPLSESERLARRAISRRQAEHDAVLTGQAARAGQMQSAAMADENTVAKRLMKGSSAIVPTASGDFTQLASKIENSNTLLTAIKDSLEVMTL